MIAAIITWGQAAPTPIRNWVMASAIAYYVIRATAWVARDPEYDTYFG